MAHQLPTLNLVCRYWRYYDYTHQPMPPTEPPFLGLVPCQLRQSMYNLLAFPNEVGLTMVSAVLFPKHADVRGPTLAFQGDMIEVPQGTGRFYTCIAVEDRAKGFTNEYRVALSRQLVDVIGGWPFPTP